MGTLFFPWWAVALSMGIYTTRYRGYELIATMVLVDGYYGAFSGVPLLTMSAIAVVVMMTYVRPLLRAPENLL